MFDVRNAGNQWAMYASEVTPQSNTHTHTYIQYRGTGSQFATVGSHARDLRSLISAYEIPLIATGCHLDRTRLVDERRLRSDDAVRTWR